MDPASPAPGPLPCPAPPPDLHQEDPPPAYADADSAARLRDALWGVGYTEPTLAALLGLADMAGLRMGARPVQRARARGDAPLAVLARLFALGDGVPAALVEAALRPAPLSAWLSAGLLTPAAGGDLRATVQLLPWRQPGPSGARDLLIASDRARYVDPPPDHVMGLAAPTRKLAGLTVRRPIARALDLGTGCGALALLAAAHAGQVVATDLNPRAVALCAGNARLNDLPHIDCRAGDLFQPVAGERFDLIVSNPPFAVAPRGRGPRLLYRDSGLVGDGLCRRLLAQAQAHLTEGGLCQALINWEIPEGQDPQQAISAWFQDSACDVWILWGRVLPVAEYAALWIAQTERDDQELREALHAEWLAELSGRGVAAVGYGLVTLRRRATDAPGRPWLRYEEAPVEVGPCGDALWRGLLLRDYLEAHDDQALLGARLRVPDELRLERTLHPTATGFAPETDAAYLSRGLGYRAEVNGPVFLLLGACRGQRTLREVLGDLAANLRQPLEALLGPCLPIVRQMLGQGLLLPEGID